jgi:tetratricopeptide (TPR) repeat protein
MPTVRASDSLKTLFSKAESAFSAKNYKKAIDLLNEILERQPRNRRAQALMKEIYATIENNKATAIKNIQKAEKSLEAGNADEALSLLHDAQINDPDANPEKISNIQNNARLLRRDFMEARILLEAGKSTEAFDRLNILANQYPQSDEIEELRQRSLRESHRQGPSPAQYMMATVFVFICVIFFLRLLGLL